MEPDDSGLVTDSGDNGNNPNRLNVIDDLKDKTVSPEMEINGVVKSEPDNGGSELQSGNVAMIESEVYK